MRDDNPGGIEMSRLDDKSSEVNATKYAKGGDGINVRELEASERCTYDCQAELCGIL